MSNKVGSLAEDYTDTPKTTATAMERGIQTAWRTETLSDLTYTQFLILVREGHVERVRYSFDMRKAFVTTRESAPGRGRDTVPVGLIYDPGLYDMLCANGVVVELGNDTKMSGLQAGLLRMLGPLIVTIAIVGWSMTLGRSPDSDDPLFGGARMELVRSNEVQTTFEDVAGIDDIKGEIMEVVSFLQDQDRYLELGAKAPAGVLLCGPPGMGKTLLAKAIAGEAGVPFYSSSGADFSNMFVGVGAARVRDMFERARRNAPCILFIDEFDGVGQARSSEASGSEENVQTINQMLTEMDGFSENQGVVVLAATNRPTALDEALTRPGRFDRIITIPYPNLAGRIDILKVHGRGKQLDEDLNFHRIARATAGFSGAELMNLMNLSAIEAVRQQREMIEEDDVFLALEKIHNEKHGNFSNTDAADDGRITPLVRRAIATYMASKALIGLITPHYDELQKVVVTPDGSPTGYTYFIPQDAHLETDIITRSYMESHVVVALGGRVGEVAVMGAGNVTTAGASDIMHANAIARDMIFKCGWSPRVGPVNITTENADLLSGAATSELANMSPQMASVALVEIQQLMAAAEAKAYFGLVCNWELLEAMVDSLMAHESHILTRIDIRELLKKHPAVEFEDCYTDGFGFDASGRLVWPKSYSHLVENADSAAAGRASAIPIVTEALHNINPDVHPLNPYQPDDMYVPMHRYLGDEEEYFKPEAFYARTPAPAAAVAEPATSADGEGGEDKDSSVNEPAAQ